MSRIDLYGYIAKLLSPGKYTSFDQNRGSIEIDIYVQKPDIEQGQPIVSWDGTQTSEGVKIYSFDRATKFIATFEASMFDKLTPNVTFTGGNVKLEKLQATVPSGKKGKYRVTFNGSLKPGEYFFTASLKSGKNEDVQKIKLTTGLLLTGLEENQSNDSPDKGKSDPGENELIDYLKALDKGQEIEFGVTPTSKDTIPQNQFRIIMSGVKKKNDTTKNDSQSVIGLRITPNMQLMVPFESESISTKIVWVDPMDPQSNIVQIFPSEDGKSFTSQPSLPRPSISIIGSKIVTVSNPKKPTFDLSFKIASPFAGGTISSPKLEVISQTFNKKNIRLEMVSQAKTGENTYIFSFAVIGKPGVPLSKGINGTMKCNVSASLNFNGENSFKSKQFEYSILF